MSLRHSSKLHKKYTNSTKKTGTTNNLFKKLLMYAYSSAGLHLLRGRENRPPTLFSLEVNSYMDNFNVRDDKSSQLRLLLHFDEKLLYAIWTSNFSFNILKVLLIAMC